ncbi:hypothetical protein GCAAIG_02780 [Candidatus Electronema halotolerans]
MSQEININDEITSLREEIVESQKARMDFLKYKLIAIASLGAIGLGFNGNTTGWAMEPDYILCIIPFVCAYVDLLCYHNNIRILVVACFLNYSNDPYEKYVGELCSNSHGGGRYLFNLEDFVLYWSSMAMSIILMGYSLVPFLRATNPSIMKGIIFLLVGIISLIVIYLAEFSYRKHLDVLFDASGKIKKGCAQCRSTTA